MEQVYSQNYREMHTETHSVLWHVKPDNSLKICLVLPSKVTGLDQWLCSSLGSVLPSTRQVCKPINHIFIFLKERTLHLGSALQPHSKDIRYCLPETLLKCYFIGQKTSKINGGWAQTMLIAEMLWLQQIPQAISGHSPNAWRMISTHYLAGVHVQTTNFHSTEQMKQDNQPHVKEKDVEMEVGGGEMWKREDVFIWRKTHEKWGTAHYLLGHNAGVRFLKFCHMVRSHTERRFVLYT